MASVCGSKQARAACCASADAQMNRFCASFSIALIIQGGTTSQPSRQPVMLKYFEKLLTRHDVVAERGAPRPVSRRSSSPG